MSAPSSVDLRHAGAGGRRRALRVLFLVSAYPSDARPWAGIFHRTLAEAVRDAGMHVEVAAPVPFVPPGFEHLSRKWRQYSSTPYHACVNGIEVYAPRYMQVPGGDTWGASHRFIEKAVGASLESAPDIIHAHYAYPPGLAALGLSKRWKIPYVLTLHGSDVHTNPHVNPRAMERFNEAVAGAACVTAVSSALADQAEAMSGRRPLVIPIGVRLEAYERLPGKREARARLGLPAEGTLVLFIGSLAREKGVKELMGALDAETTMRGVVLGEGPLKMEMSAHPSLVCMGSRPNTEVPLFMKACDMLVLPSYAEGMPTVLVEAGAAQLPIVASRAGGIPELLGEGRGLLLDEISERSVREAIARVALDPDGAAERSRRMRAFIEAHYDARKNAMSFAEKYRACVRAAKPS